MYKSRTLHKLLTWIVICAQVIALAGTATVGVLQPTSQMAQEAAQQAGLGDWLSQVAARITQTLQPLWGEAATAEASAIRDVGPQSNYQILTTVHPEENWVVNGSFESSPIIANGTGSRIVGWSILAGNSDIWSWWISPDGSRKQLHLSGDQTGSISQIVTGLQAGQSYYFEFDYTSETGAQSARAQIIDSGGSDLINEIVNSPGRPDGPGWRAYRNLFTAPANGQVEIRFTQTSPVPGTLSAFTIDDVRIAQRLINYVTNGSFEAGWPGLNQTNIPGWTVASGKVDVWNGYYNADQSLHELDLAGTPGPGVITQAVNGLTAGQSYIFEFDYTVNAFGGEQAKAQVLDGASPLIDQTVTTNGDPNLKGWKHFRQSFTAPASGSVTLRFQDLSSDVHTYHGITIDNVRVADLPLNYVVNGDFEASPSALNIANDALPGWTVTSGPLDNFHPGLLYDKAIDLNGSPGNGKIEQLVTGLQAGQVYAFQFNYQNHAWWTTYAYARLLDSSNAKLYEKRVSCKGHVVHQGWCTLRYFFTAPANGQVKIVFENDEADGNAFYGTNIDNVLISRNLNYVVNGNYSSGPTGLNQTNVPGWAVSGPTDTHDGFGGEYRFTVDLNGTPGDGKLRQVITGLAPGQPYTLRYNYASTAHNYLVRFDVKVIDATGATTLVSANQSTDQLPYVGGWKQAEHTFIAPADGIVQVIFANNETDNNLYYAALLDNIQLWGQAATAGTEINVCNNTVLLPRTVDIAPGGVSNGLAHWVRADMDVYSDTGSTAAVEGDAVQQWNDLSGGGLDLTQTTAGQKPTYRAGVARGNFNPTLDFTDDFIRNTSRVVQTSDDLTFIAVGDTDVTSGVRTLYGMGDNYNDPTMDLEATWISPWFDGGGTVDLFTTQTLPTNQAMIWGMRGVNGDTNGMHFNYSGEDVQMNMTVANQANYGQNIGLGSDGGGEDWDGRIPEAMTYSRNLSTAEMEKVYSYLAVKYGITMRLSTVAASTASGNYVSSAGTLIWNYSGNSNYHYDVAGIGRDDASGLEQKQSNSVNSDNLVTMGLGGIAADNFGNLNSFDADQSFLLWGNNDAATAIATSVSVSLTRMARIWTVQETTPVTSTVGVVTVRVPQSALGLGAGQAAFLLRSVDPVFTNSDTLLFMTCDGTNCTAEIDLADGDYFSFGRASVAPEITVTPTSHNFGSVGLTESAPVKNIVISNSGNAPLNLTSIQMTNTGSGQFTHNNSCGAVLNPGASCTVGVTFTPSASGAQSGVLTIVSNDSDEASVAVNLSGTGVVQAPDISVAPATLTFSNTVINSAAPAQLVTISNVGTGNLAIQNLTLSGANSDQFTLVSTTGTCYPLTKNLNGGESCTVEVVFSPTSVGAKTATLNITSNDTDEIVSTVTLNGSGITCTGLLNTANLAADVAEMIAADNRATACVAGTAVPDTDGDGVYDNTDQDDDNDGILDTVEDATALGATKDSDGDGIPDRLDLDSDNDGINDVREAGGTDADGNGKADGAVNGQGIPASAGAGLTPPDSDGDGRKDFQDLDSDNDTISDLVEGTPTGYPMPADANNDGMADGPDRDYDGIVDSADGNDLLVGDSGDLPPANSDGDAKPNYTDPDSNDAADTTGDGNGDDIDDAGNGALDAGPTDGKVDSPTDPDQDGVANNGGVDTLPGVFGGIGSPTADSDGDGVVNSSDLDDDGDGIPDTVETTADKDGDGIPNSLDLDSDNDGINDVREAGGLTDANGDGKADGADGNGDGMIDSPANTPVNSDNDAQPDYLDIDSDNDTISDLVEGAPNGHPGATDANNDGVADGPDQDRDGIVDSADGIDNLFGDRNDAPPINSDGDAKPNYTDPDSNDATDTTGNGTGDDIDDAGNGGLDGNGDGKVDNTADTDSDGAPDVIDTLDNTFGGLPLPDLDADGDGKPNSADLDDDGDGIPDAVEGMTDSDGDGIPNQWDLDSDNDGINDVREAGGLADANGDGKADGTDANADGMIDSPAATPVDSDGDSKPDYLDIDSDNDTISDLVEGGSGATDANNDGVADGPDTDHDGIVNSADGNDALFGDASDPAPTNSDGDAKPNYTDPDSNDATDTTGNGTSDDINDAGNGGLDAGPVDGKVDATTDSDGDGAPDVIDSQDTVFGGLGSPTADPDGDGKPNSSDMDDDNDGIPDSVEGTGDKDGDGIPNSLDLDSDNDGLNDVREAGGLTDANGDGKADGTDGNSDGMIDSPANSPVDSDSDTQPDYLDIDSDNDTLSDLAEGGSGATDANNDGIADGPDADYDGIVDSADGNDALFGDASDPAPINTDGDAKPNYTDPDSDDPADTTGDGNGDDIDGTPNSGLDGNGDGKVDSTTDTDGDGAADVADQEDGLFGGLPVITTAKILPVKVLLQGAYNVGSGLMNDNLRSLASFPLTSPYGDGATLASSSVLTANNIVDWVLIELRGTGALSTTVVASKAALLQRDGDVVATDGISTLTFTGLAGSSYHVVVKHRNHLGIMTANPVALSGSTPLVDFTNPATPVFIRTRTVAQKAQSGKMLMWGGDANGDGDVKGSGPGTDAGAVRLAVLGAPGNSSFAANYIAVGYAKADVTMNGQTIGAGSGNEISNVILPNVLSHPGNPTLQNNFIICQQLPEDPCN